jgi:hypothetical protein
VEDADHDQSMDVSERGTRNGYRGRCGIRYFVFQGEGLTAIFFGLPPTIAIGGSLWLTRNFFTEELR